MDKMDNWDWFGDGMLHRNHFPNFFVLTLLQVAINLFYNERKAWRDLEGYLYEAVSNGPAKLQPEMIEFGETLQAEIREIPESTKENMREIRESIKDLGTPAPRSWLF